MEQPKQQGQGLNIKINDSELRGAYSNVMQVAHSKEEFWLDFFTAFPPQGILGARVIISPGHFKRMISAMQENLKRYEAQFGEVSLAPEPKKEFGF